MDYDEQDRPGWVRLPPAHGDDAWASRPAAASRADGVRRVRRASNWTAAALIAGVAAATGYFAHHPAPATTTVGATTQVPVAGQPGAAGQAGAANQAGAAGQVSVASPGHASGSAPVVTSGGSGVAAGPVSGTAVTGTGPATARAGTATAISWRDN